MGFVAGQFRNAVQRLLQPVWRRIELVVAARVQPISDRLHELEAEHARRGSTDATSETRVIALENHVRALQARQESAEARVTLLERQIKDLSVQLATSESGLEQVRNTLMPLQSEWQQHMPTFLNTADTVGALGRKLVELEEKVDHGDTGSERGPAPDPVGDR